jgi:beta-alanine degradation protein BauB
MRVPWLCLLAIPAAICAQDPVRISPDCKVEIENSSVRVLRVTHAPPAKIAMHEHPASVAVCLTDLHERLTLPDGAAREVSLKAGEVAYNEAAKHAEESLSDQPLEAVIIELNPSAPKWKGWPVELDPVKLDPEHHLVPLENDRVRALRTILEPHLRSPRRQRPSYVVVYLTELHTTMTLADGRTVDNPRRPGEIAWRDPLEHVTENIGDHTAVEIQVELK